MEFFILSNLIQENFKEMTKDATHLFEVSLDKEALWNCYLDSFPVGSNDLFRERREHDCSSCRQFVKNIGNAVVIKDNKVHTIWDVQTNDATYQPVMDALSNFVKAHAVSDIYISKFKKIGTEKNFELLSTGSAVQWDHFYLELPDKFVDKSNRSVGDIQGSFRDVRNVFKRSLDEISKESLLTVLELIAQKTLYKGEEWQSVLNKFLVYKKAYEKLTVESEKEYYAWDKSLEAGSVIGKIRNHSIGTLLVNISEGMDLEVAVKKYEVIVAPSNYKRPNPVYSQRQLDEMKKQIMELGYFESLGRRYATLDDITINNILFSNRDAATRISGSDVFAEMEREASSTPKKFSKVEEMSIEHFVEHVLPTTNALEVYLENQHAGNMVSLIGPKVEDSKSMFKWDNSFSWAYAGNVTDSLKERVKAAGGSVDGVLRFSIQWNESGKDNSDLDAHCIEPDGYEIYFGSARKPSISRMGGQLDIDITHPNTTIAVENITWPDKSRMRPGTYKFFVNQYADRGNKDGFKAEIEFDGQIYSFNYNRAMRTRENVPVAEVTLHKDGSFTIKESLPANVSSRDVWNLHTNQFVPVTVMMYSPNYWNVQTGLGHRHYFFMLKDCKNPESPNGFYNEFLNHELEKNKHAFAALGSKMRVEDSEDQLSGIGFSATKRADVTVKVKGATERVFKIKF